MKKLTLLLILAVGLIFSATNLQAQVTIGSNANPDANALLDLKNKADGTADKGFLLPRVALTSTASPAPLTAHVAGMTVYNAAPAVNDVTPGYYYNDGKKWVRQANAYEIEWIYNPSSAKIELKRSGTAPFNNRVYYKPNGGYISIDGTGADDYAYNYTYKNSSAFSKPTGLEKLMNSTIFNIDTYDGASGCTADRTSIYLPVTLAGDYISSGIDPTIVSKVNSLNKYNPGKNKYLIADFSYLRMDNGSVDGYAVAQMGSVIATTNGSIENMTGFGSQVTTDQRQTGIINMMHGFNAQMGFVNATTTTVNRSIAFYGDQFVRDAASKPNIGTAAGFWYDGFALGATNIPGSCQNHYGIYLNNINRAVNNYAIYTNAGTVSFGDNLYMRSGNAYKPGGGPWENISDIRSKENIVPYQKGLKELLQINPVNFNYKKEMNFGTDTYTGVIAQELENIVPSMVKEVQQGEIKDFKTVDGNEFTYMLINAVKEQQKEIDELKVMVRQLIKK